MLYLVVTEHLLELFTKEFASTVGARHLFPWNILLSMEVFYRRCHRLKEV